MRLASWIRFETAMTSEDWEGANSLACSVFLFTKKKQGTHAIERLQQTFTALSHYVRVLQNESTHCVLTPSVDSHLKHFFPRRKKLVIFGQRFANILESFFCGGKKPLVGKVLLWVQTSQRKRLHTGTDSKWPDTVFF